MTEKICECNVCLLVGCKNCSEHFVLISRDEQIKELEERIEKLEQGKNK